MTAQTLTPQEMSLRLQEVTQTVERMARELIQSGYGRIEVVIRDHRVQKVDSTTTWVRPNNQR